MKDLDLFGILFLSACLFLAIVGIYCLQDLNKELKTEVSQLKKELAAYKHNLSFANDRYDRYHKNSFRVWYKLDKKYEKCQATREEYFDRWSKMKTAAQMCLEGNETDKKTAARSVALDAPRKPASKLLYTP